MMKARAAEARLQEDKKAFEQEKRASAAAAQAAAAAAAAASTAAAVAAAVAEAEAKHRAAGAAGAGAAAAAAAATGGEGGGGGGDGEAPALRLRLRELEGLLHTACAERDQARGRVAQLEASSDAAAGAAREDLEMRKNRGSSCIVLLCEAVPRVYRGFSRKNAGGTLCKFLKGCERMQVVYNFTHI